VTDVSDAVLTPEEAGEMRHELRTPVNHIVGYAELLAEDVDVGSPAAAALGEISAAARDVLALISAALPPAGATRRDDLAALFAQLRAPQKSILSATAKLIGQPHDTQFAADVQRITQAAHQLLNVPVIGAREPSNEATGEAPSVRAPTPVGTETIPSPTQSRGRILVVDDVEENRAVLSRRLSREGYYVEDAASGEDALARVAGDSFDLVLLDVRMPGLDGFAVLERIKQDPATRNLPVIMISALDDLASVVRCIEHGAEDYLAKPFDQVLLRARIGASLEKKRWHDKEADYLRQVARVTDAAGEVEQGTYTPGALDGLTTRDDHLGRLARVFDTMAAGVRARETKLRAQLDQLRADVSAATTEHRVVTTTADAGTDALVPGATLAGRYEIREVFGRGGMGVVYRAHDRDLDEEVAIKTIRRDLLTGDPVVAEQLKSEIRLARRISHRNVVRTHDLGEADGIAYVTMEFVEGLTVRELLTTHGTLGIASALGLARQFTEALAVAHDAGLVHRDVNPENALHDARGVLKVIYFGIDRLAAAAATSGITASGAILGTPAYKAPEQLVGDEVDARADLYALGVVLYECLTGDLPYQANSVVSLIAKALTLQPTPPNAKNPDVPPALSALVMRLLSKTPADRPAHANELLEALAELG
jgi:CheY-like chemotaxis protein